MSFDKTRKLDRIYRVLDSFFGPLGWWPAGSPFEVMVGAVLTQNTAWRNVEKAIDSLRKNKALTPRAMASLSDGELAGLIRSAGYFNVKASRLKELCAFFIRDFNCSVSKASNLETDVLRRRLLRVKGIGPETADSILLYAFEKPVFVVDAYTRRIFFRHGLIEADASYEAIQNLVRDNFKSDEKTLNQFHAVLVETAKRFCGKTRTLCEECPLREI